MTQYTIAIGDWSDDGHGKYDDFIVDIPIAYTAEQLHENFTKNVELFGFGPHEFAEAYEDGSLPVEKLEVLLRFGFDASNIDTDYAWVNQNNEESVYISAGDMLNIVMFYFGHGLSAFEWMHVNAQHPPALIGYGAPHSVGYGLYS